MTTAQQLWDNVVDGEARENASETEEVPYQDRMDHGPAWTHIALLTAEEVIDSLTSELECSSYGLAKPITERTAKVLRRIAKATYGGAR